MERTDMTDRFAALREATSNGAPNAQLLGDVLAELEGLKADAARFRWLAENHVDYIPCGYNGCKYGRHDMLFKSDHSDLRAAIDAAMKGEP